MFLVVLSCSVVGVWGIMIFIFTVMRVVGGVLLRVVCVFRHADVVYGCLLCTLFILETFFGMCIIFNRNFSYDILNNYGIIFT